MRDIRHYVNGQSVEGRSGRFSDVFNPNTGEVQARVALASVEELDAAVQAAAAVAQSPPVQAGVWPPTQWPGR